MSEGYDCPVEGCERTDLDSPDSVQMHVVATNDDAHNEATEAKVWQDLDSEESAAESDQDGETDPEDADDDSDPEEDTDMPSDEEYREQYENQQDSDGDADGDSDGSSGFSLPALDRSTMMLLVGVLAVLLLAYVLLNRDGGDGVDHAEAVEQDTEESSDAVSGEEVTLIE